MRRFLLLVFIAGTLWNKSAAQDVDRDVFKETLALVGKLGPMKDSSLRGIVGAITAKCNSEACTAYAIYIWTAQNIAYDCRHSNRGNNTASYALQTREANSEGYANLIAEMCRIAHLQCEVVYGLAKWDVNDIGHVDPNSNAAAWNKIVVGKKQYVLDASRSAGYCEGKHFTNEVSDAWFLANRRLFALSHFPDDKRMQLLDTAIERNEFVNAPIIGIVAPILSLVPQPGMRGLIRGRQDDTLHLSFEIFVPERAASIHSVGILSEGKDVPVAFSKENGVLNVAVPLPAEGEYPLTLLVNHNEAFSFQVKAMPALKRKK